MKLFTKILSMVGVKLIFLPHIRTLPEELTV